MLLDFYLYGPGTWINFPAAPNTIEIMCSEISTLEKGYEGKLSKRSYSYILKEFETGKVSQSFPQFVASFQFFDEINQPAVHFLF